MLIRFTKFNLPLAFFLAGLFFICPSCLAFSGTSQIAINPTHIEIESPPGAHVAQTVKFWNGTDQPLGIHVEGADLAQQDEEGHAAVALEDAANSLKAWIKPDIPDLFVSPKQDITLEFSIDVPANADPGSHWGAILVTTAPQLSGPGVAIQPRIGAVVIVRVEGEAKEKLSLDSFSVPPFLDSPPIDVVARFRNEGTVHEAPAGNIEVRNWLGWLVATGTLPLRNVLPNAVRKLTGSVGGGVWFGKYRVVLSASYGEPMQEIQASVAVWVVPWRTYAPFALGALILIGLAFWQRRRFRRSWYVFRTGEENPDWEKLGPRYVRK